ncbi:MAG: hypothetical protein M3461_01110 [Pseudomonadota bacterium]|nr:hypothetical protein [Pseudomonadota bacterium]
MAAVTLFLPDAVASTIFFRRTSSDRPTYSPLAVAGDEIRPETIALEHFECHQLYHTRRAIVGMRLERGTPRSLLIGRSLPEDSRA